MKPDVEADVVFYLEENAKQLRKHAKREGSPYARACERKLTIVDGLLRRIKDG